VDRHRVWVRRQAGMPQHWSEDPILQRNKFTNVYRVLDHGSQFLLTELLTGRGTAVDFLARAYLYRMSNLPQLWEHTHRELGFYPYADELSEDLAELWASYRDEGNQVFSGAYMIVPHVPGTPSGFDKAREVVRMAARSFHPDSPEFITPRFLKAGSMEERFKVLQSVPGIGNFIAMQVLTDFGYSRFGADQDENSFVVPGPGAVKGARELFPKAKPLDVIHWCRERVLELPDCPMLGGRPPSLMDIQNTLCEFSKYARFMRKPTPARVFKPAHPGPQPDPVLPVHWSY
jgi:hypothetical protein